MECTLLGIMLIVGAGFGMTAGTLIENALEARGYQRKNYFAIWHARWRIYKGSSRAYPLHP